MKVQSDNPKVIYEQNIDSLTIQLIQVDNKNSVKWQTKLINQKNKNELILNEESRIKGIAWHHYQFIGDDPDEMYKLANAFISGMDLIIIYYQFGTLLLRQYHFTDPLKFKMKEIILGGAMALPSYGEVTAEAKFIRIGNDIFISACFGQSLRGVKKKLFKLDITNFIATEIIFDSKPVRFMAVTFGEEAKGDFKYLKNKKDQNLLTPSLEKKLLLLTEHSGAPYYLKQLEMGENSDLRKNVDSFYDSFRDAGLTLYRFFSENRDMFGNRTTYPTLQEVERYSRQILLFYRPELKEQIKILGYISNDYIDRETGYSTDIFIFYQDGTGGIKILQYQMYPPMWILSDFTEQKVID